jgi:hypothetical protein
MRTERQEVALQVAENAVRFGPDNMYLGEVVEQLKRLNKK